MTAASVLLADARFLLPSPVSSVTLSAASAHWADDLARHGLRVATAGPADLTVHDGPAPDLPAGGHHLVLSGSRRGGGTRLTAVPRRGDPQALVPLGAGAVTRWAVAARGVAQGRAAHARSALGGALLGAGVPVGLSTLALHPAHPGPPWLVAEAVRHGLVEPGPVLLLPAPPGSRSVLLVTDAAGRPRRVLKFSRDPNLVAPFRDEIRGAQLVARAGGVVAAHAPAHLGAFTAHGHDALVEAFLPGVSARTLVAEGRGQVVMTALGSWLLAVARVTRADDLADERTRLREQVVNRPEAGPQAAAALDALGPMPSVLEHGDLGPTNVVVHHGRPAVLDWETARRPGWALWDLLYAHDEANAWEPGARDLPRAERFLRLFRGELPGSALLFSQVRAHVDALALDPADVGRAATLCWADRAVGVADAPRDSHPDDTSLHLARPALWAADPALGPGWDRWR